MLLLTTRRVLCAVARGLYRTAGVGVGLCFVCAGDVDAMRGGTRREHREPVDGQSSRWSTHTMKSLVAGKQQVKTAMHKKFWGI